ncbi:MAG: cbb3-type cytochrome oxidase assembly protein CcoS [Gammaproteobacteria bacterium]|nr:cbb3-type cytochrome oxidase assembly protein CcoS [Gammaproteobacteria bacterium]
MEVIYYLVPVALVILVIAVAIFFWAVKSGQYDDMEGPAHRILMDDDPPPAEPPDGDERKDDP